MSTSAGPNIVEDGLVLCLDAANEKSYPGSGTTWTDIVNTEKNGTLTNGVSYSNGSLLFDGVNDYFDMSGNVFSVAGLTEYSASMWINIDSSETGVDVRFFWHGNYGVLIYKTSANNISYYLRTDLGALQETSPIPYFDNFFNIAATYDGSTMKLFINGEEKDSRSQSLGIVNAVPTRFWLGGASGNYFSKCKISNVSVYTKTLTESEIEQNFNALRGRYGI